MGRKFSPTAKYALLENIDLILDDVVDGVGDTYDGNPWDHHQDKFRLNGTDYYMIENGYLRKISDLQTLKSLHHKMEVDDKGIDTHTTKLTPIDLAAYPIGMALPSRRDGQLLKAKKEPAVWYMRGGKRHIVPNMDTLFSLKDDQNKSHTIDTITILYDTDLMQIELGEELDDVNTGKPAPTKAKRGSTETFRDRRARNSHVLGDRGRDTRHHTDAAAKVVSKLIADTAVAAETSATATTLGTETGGNTTGAGLEKWLYQSETAGVDNEEFASQKTLLGV